MLFAVAAAQHLVGTARRKCFGLNFTMSRTQKRAIARLRHLGRGSMCGVDMPLY